MLTLRRQQALSCDCINVDGCAMKPKLPGSVGRIRTNCLTERAHRQTTWTGADVARGFAGRLNRRTNARPRTGWVGGL